MKIEQEGKVKINLMTQSTYEWLLSQVEVARLNVKESLLEIGEAAGSQSDWHDNAAFDYANMKYDTDTLNLIAIESEIKNVEIIKPSLNRDEIELGSCVVVRFEDEDEDELFTILGPVDSRRNDNWISFESPLGSMLMGRKKGETVDLEIGDREIRVSVVEILPGDF